MIRRVFARKILNSRGQATLEVEVHGEEPGISEAPTGQRETTHGAVAFPKGVDAAIESVNVTVSKNLRGLDESNLLAIDGKLLEFDGQENFSGRLGGAAAIATSVAVTKATAAAAGKPLFKYLNPEANEFPFPVCEVIGGTDVKGFLVIPAGAKSVSEAVFSNAAVRSGLMKILSKASQPTAQSAEETLESISSILPTGGKIGLNLSATNLWNGEKYVYLHAKKSFTPGEHLDFLLDLIKTYKLDFLEDPFHEEDFESFAELTRKTKNVLICAGDLYSTQMNRLSEGIRLRAANSTTIIPNQNGLLSRTLDVMECAREAGLRLVLSSSGETFDAGISHLAVAQGALLLKTGELESNELIRIWETVESPKMASWRQ